MRANTGAQMAPGSGQGAYLSYTPFTPNNSSYSQIEPGPSMTPPPWNYGVPTFGPGFSEGFNPMPSGFNLMSPRSNLSDVGNPSNPGNFMGGAGPSNKPK